MADWNETCSQAPNNKPYRSSQTAQAEGETMALHPGEAGHDEQFEKKCEISEAKYPYRGEATQQKQCIPVESERRSGCADLSPRNRRADLRMSDITRLTEKVVAKHIEDKPCVQGNKYPTTQQLPAIEPPSEELLRLLDAHKKNAENTTGADVSFPGKMVRMRITEPQRNEFDLNTPGSLKQLRWEIYDLIERYEGDYGRTISMTLRSEIEDLFKKYTHS